MLCDDDEDRSRSMSRVRTRIRRASEWLPIRREPKKSTWRCAGQQQGRKGDKASE